jgi:hypothetical protein
MHNGLLRCAFCALSLLVIMVLAGPALAHEDRMVGPFEFAVGFGEEPPYAGQKNSVQLLLHDAQTGKPIVDLGNTLKVRVTYQGQEMSPLAMEPDFEIGEFGTPGDYRAWFFPTRPGKYTFRFTGTIRGERVHESFISSPTGFSEVEDPQQVEFPAQDPTTAQLSQRLDREVPRLESALDSATSRAEDDAASARTVGIVGIAAGVVALIVAVAALVRRRA